MLCAPDARRGRQLMENVMEGGNFGKYSEAQKLPVFSRWLNDRLRPFRRQQLFCCRRSLFLSCLIRRLLLFCFCGVVWNFFFATFYFSDFCGVTICIFSLYSSSLLTYLCQCQSIDVANPKQNTTIELANIHQWEADVLLP